MIIDEQWKGIENCLKKQFCSASFDYRGIEISIERREVSEGKTELAIYIDGALIGGAGDANAKEYDPLTRLFWCKSHVHIYTTKSRHAMTKLYGKRRVKKLHPDIDDKVIRYSPFFKTAKSLVTHYKKIDGLELKELSDGRLFANV